VLRICCSGQPLIQGVTDCVHLTDLSVFELSSLPKLRRIGLVRVSNITDEAIYTLANRHATLERIHLSYCDQISVMAIHFLLQKLHKLTHLSLTGIPAFRKPELQKFCRPPPSVWLFPHDAFSIHSHISFIRILT
jgi:F-box and leucine-rich repeat protein GRR1